MTKNIDPALQQYANVIHADLIQPFYKDGKSRQAILTASPVEITKLNASKVEDMATVLAMNLCKDFGITYSRYLQDQHITARMREVLLMHRQPAPQDSSRVHEMLCLDRDSLIERVGRVLLSGTIETGLMKFHESSMKGENIIEIKIAGTLLDVDSRVASTGLTVLSIVDSIIDHHEYFMGGTFSVRCKTVTITDEGIELLVTKVWKIKNFATIHNT